jgi:hypothetical protein
LVATIDPWREEYDGLTRAVEERFRQATRRFAVPSTDGCRMVATYLMALRYRDKDHEAPTGQTKVDRYARLFLHHLLAERRQIEKLISIASRGNPALPWLREQQGILARIDETSRQIEWLLSDLLPIPNPFREPIRLLAARAQEAWAETNGGRAPRSTNPDDPLCRFVVAALTAIDQQRSAAAVSEVLRGRQRKPKDG